MSLSSYLTCNLVPRRGAAVDPYDGPQPQTATCCTALQRGFTPDGLAQPRYAPLRTPGSAALLGDDQPRQLAAEQMVINKDGGGGGICIDGKMTTTTPTKKKVIKKVVRKCKSTVEDVDVSQLIEGPRLRRSSGMRRDWSFEDLRAGNKAA
ncbi:uncharacterized protein LOC133922178 [Phragmites australis]|uniref:uncharacterized protein LOC133922178 n=1 Tax=Phragmites australis TaxID=29695 RepID=UPI002D7838FC|nr:uncharacterized protein LOC133922178 [Phragmites australis]